MVGIKDVAIRAGVSVASVSRVLNSPSSVRPERRQRVLQAIEELGYEPNELARSWRTGVTRSLATVTVDSGINPHINIAIHEAIMQATANNFAMFVYVTYRDVESERRYLQILRRRHVDGVLFNNTGLCDDELKGLVEKGIPVVLFNRPLGNLDLPIDAVCVDRYYGTSLVINHLLSLGHRRIAAFGKRGHDWLNREGVRAYRNVLEAHGIAFDERLVRWYDTGSKAGGQVAADLLTSSPRPDALWAMDQDAGLTALDAVKRLGLRVPHDIALVVFDDIKGSHLFDPPLTLVRNPAEELGQVAMELLLSRLANHKLPPREVMLRPTLVVRRSCGWTGSYEYEEEAPSP